MNKIKLFSFKLAFVVLVVGCSDELKIPDQKQVYLSHLENENGRSKASVSVHGSFFYTYGTMVITWNDSGWQSQSITIYLYKNGSYVSSIITVPFNQFRYDLTIPNSSWLVPGCGFKIKIASTSTPSNFSFSNEFCIYEGSPPPPPPPSAPTSVASTFSPSQNGVWTTWTDNATNEVNHEVQVSFNSGAFQTIGTIGPSRGGPPSGTTVWFFHTVTSGGSYRYRVRAIGSIAGNNSNWVTGNAILTF